MAQLKEVCSSPPVRGLKSQLAVEHPSTEGPWKPHKKRYPIFQEKGEATMKWQDHNKIKSYTYWVGSSGLLFHNLKN